MTEVTIPQEETLVLQAAAAVCMVKNARWPTILETRAISADVADRVSKLGYSEVSPDMLRALLRTGGIPEYPDTLMRRNRQVLRRFSEML